MAAALTAAALIPIAALELIFPEGGTQPFAPSAFYPALLGALFILAAVPAAASGAADRRAAVLRRADRRICDPHGRRRERRAPRARCSPLHWRPACSSVAGDWPRGCCCWLAPALIYWQANAPISDFLAANWDPAVAQSYYAPLLGELRTLGVGYGLRPARIEIVPDENHPEARWVAPHIALARGWERQLDVLRNALFYDEATPLTPARYGAWLSAQAVSYVALPTAARLDYSADRRGAPGARAGARRHAGLPARSLALWRLAAVRGARRQPAGTGAGGADGDVE